MEKSTSVCRISIDQFDWHRYIWIVADVSHLAKRDQHKSEIRIMANLSNLGTVTYKGAMTGGKEVVLDFDACPESSVKYALNAGVTYLFANRAASTLTGWIKSEIIGESGRKPVDVPAAEVKAWRDANKEQVESWQSDIVNQTLEDFNTGSIGVREPAAPKDDVDPLSAEMHRLAKEGVIRILEKNGHKFPTRSKNPTTGKMEPEKFVTSDGAFTGPELVARYVRNYADNLQPEINGGKSLRDVATAVLKLRQRGANESAMADISAL